MFRFAPLAPTCAVLAAFASFVCTGPAHAAGMLETLPRNPVFSAKSKKETPPGPTDKETKMGEKATESIEKNPKVKILDPAKDAQTKALYDKLGAMASELGKASARPDIQYKVKIIDDKQINAFTLPNGGVYFYTGLLDALGSDDEIAAVMAHEISHNACMHFLRGDAKAKQMSWVALAAVLASLAGGKNGGNLAAFSQYAMMGVMSGYSVEYEKEADASAVEMMRKTAFNPSALVTVMQRFEAEEMRRPHVDLGILQTHPDSVERAEAIEAQIRAAGLTFNPRAVSGAPRAFVEDGAGRILVRFKDMTLLEFADAGSTPFPAPPATSSASNAPIVKTASATDTAPAAPYTSPAKTRAEAAAKALNGLLSDNVKLHEIQLQEVKIGDFLTVRLIARGTEIARVLPDDAKLQSLSPLAAAQKWKANLRLIFWRETVNGAL